ncbi:MAG: DNA mismatch repair endonuclease MutL [Eubacterium sp.]|nr:DNA mismatch repair endonuclease MutL [Eubacterium sp.]
MIQVLDQETIDHIAAGEVVERPSAVVKELVENAIDAGATAITVEIKEGGISFIRITDNGSGIDKGEIPTAFLRHATSKIQNLEDLMAIHSLGFRGEALSSIAAVCQVELITKKPEEITGVRYEIQGGREICFEEVGCPSGSTFIVRNIFFNTPARRKFLKTPRTEGNYIQELLLRYSLCRTDIRFTFISDGKTKIQTNGDDNLQTNIYYNFGSETAHALVEVSASSEHASLTGFIGKPELSRGNRSLMNYYVNGRYIRSNIINRAIEEAYKEFLMNHRYPFVVLKLNIDSSLIDINVHPTKMEIRFSNQDEIYKLFYDAIYQTLKNITLIPETNLNHADSNIKTESPIVEKLKKETERTPEPFETLRQTMNYMANIPAMPSRQEEEEDKQSKIFQQMNLFKEEMIQDEKPVFRIIGQIFGTYWLLEYQEEMLIIDQHAAHEKVLFEKLMKRMREKKPLTQNLISPMVVTLSGRELDVLEENLSVFQEIGFQLEAFGDREYLITGVPADFLNVPSKELFLEMLDSLLEKGSRATDTELIIDHCATMSCKAAVKGNNVLSYSEAKKLFEEMLAMDQPYHCPHGRPTTIAMSKYEFEKKFKRIL